MVKNGKVEVVELTSGVAETDGSYRISGQGVAGFLAFLI